MIIRPPPQRPMIFAVVFLNGQIVDACDPDSHQPVLVEFPILITVAPEPIAAVVMPFIGETHSNAIVAIGPNLFNQTVIELARPFASEKRLDRLPPLKKFRPIAPAAILRISK